MDQNLDEVINKEGQLKILFAIFTVVFYILSSPIISFENKSTIRFQNIFLVDLNSNHDVRLPKVK